MVGKLAPVIESVETYCRVDDGNQSRVHLIDSTITNETLNDSEATIMGNPTDNFIIGDRVIVGGTKRGNIAFIGETHFGDGEWAGVVLDEPIGKNDGSVSGIRYFQCEPNKGVFSRLSRLQLCDETLATRPNGRITPSSDQSAYYTPARKISVGSSASGSDLKIGDRVIIRSGQGSKVGTLRFYGETNFAPGMWCGIELDSPLGKNDGSVDGVRYFECAPKFGLFVPVDKVSRSPRSAMVSPSPCNMHKPAIKRENTSDSIRSINSSLISNVSSIANPSRVRLGVNSLTKKYGPHVTSTPCKDVDRSNSPLMSQKLLKEKDLYIEQLLKERELERAEVTRAASQADEAERKLLDLQKKYEELWSEGEISKTKLSQAVSKLEKEKSDLQHQLEEASKRIEDLQFTFEEESITKTEVEELNSRYMEKVKALEQMIEAQKTQLEQANQKSTEENVLDSGHNSLAMESEYFKNECKEYEETVNFLRRELENYKGKLSEKMEENSELEKKYLVLKVDTEEASLCSSSKKIEEGPSSYRNEIENLQKEIASLKEQLKGAEAERVNFENRWLRSNECVNELESNLREKDHVVDNSIYDTPSDNSTQASTVNSIRRGVDSENQTEELKFELEEKEAILSKINEMVNRAFDHLAEIINRRTSKLSEAVITEEYGATIMDGPIDTSATHFEGEGLIDLKDCVTRVARELDNFVGKNIALLEQMNTLAEVIAKKDDELSEVSKEREKLMRDLLATRKELDGYTKSPHKIDEGTNTSFTEMRESHANTTIELTNEDLKAVLEELDNLASRVKYNSSEKYVDKVTNLRSVINNLEEDLAAKKESILVLEKTANSLEEVVKNSADERAKDIAGLRENIVTLENQLVLNEEKFDSAEKMRKAQNQELVSILRDNIAFLEKQLAEKEENKISEEKLRGSEIEKYEKEIAKLRENITDLESQLAEQQESASGNTFDLQLKDYETIISNLQEKVVNLEQKMAQKEKIMTNYEHNVIMAIEKVNSVLNMPINDIHQQTEKRAIIYGSEFLELSSDLRNTLHALEAHLNSRESSLESEIVSLRDRLYTRDHIIMNYEAEIRVYSDKIADLQSTVNTLNDTLEELEAKYNETMSNYQEVVLKLHKLEILSEESNKMRLHAEEKCADLAQENKNLESLVADKKLTSEACLKLSDEKVKNLGLKIEELLENNRLDDANIAIAVQLRVATQENVQLRKEIERLKEELKNRAVQYRRNSFRTNSADMSVESDGINDLNDLRASLFQERDSRLHLELELEGLKHQVSRSRQNSVVSHDEHRRYSKVDENNTGEINFLNSIIVDLQKKNEELAEELNRIRKVVPLDVLFNRQTKAAAPRMFCDICDIFDAHETEDCHQQMTSSPKAVPRRDRVKLPPRPYCSNCEVFGHETIECNRCDQEESF